MIQCSNLHSHTNNNNTTPSSESNLAEIRSMIQCSNLHAHTNTNNNNMPTPTPHPAVRAI
jgi:hypothetical protein